MSDSSPATTEHDLASSTFVADLDAVRAALDLDDWVVWGHSAGGPLAAMYGLRYPARTRALVLSCTMLEALDAAPVHHPANSRNPTALKALASDDKAALYPLITRHPDRALARADAGGGLHHQERIARAIPGAELVRLEDSGSRISKRPSGLARS